MEKISKIKKINKEKIKPIPLKHDNRIVKGYQVSPGPYMNLFLLAPTNSGKTCAIFHILKKICGKNSKIICFVSTQNIDESWNYIEKYFEKKNISIVVHDEIEEETDGVKINHLAELINYLKTQNEKKYNSNEDEYVDLTSQLNCLQDDYSTDEEDEIPKYQYPNYILVFDDMGDQLRNPLLTHFLKKSRHFKTKVIVSSQDWCDLPPSARKQIKQFLIFHSNGYDRLKSIYDNMSCQFDFDKFKKLYDEATIINKKDKKPFLFAIPDLNDYRICFDKKFEL